MNKPARLKRKYTAKILEKALNKSENVQDLMVCFSNPDMCLPLCFYSDCPTYQQIRELGARNQT